MLNDARIAGAVGVCSNATITKYPPALTNHAIQPAKILQSGNNLEVSGMPTPNSFAQRSSGAGSKKAEVEQLKEVKDTTAKVSPAVTPSAKIPKNNEKVEGKAKRDRDGATGVSAVEEHSRGGTDQVDAKNKSNRDSSRAEPQRAVNPFAKSSSNKEHLSSLFDSIKKMKVDNEKVEKASSKVKV